MTTARTRFDVLVLGGGPAGLVTAAELAVRGFTVCVCDAREDGRPRIGEVLPAIARPLLEEIGMLDRLGREPSAFCASMGRVSVWGSDVPVEGASIANPYGSSWYLDRTRFEAMLAQNAVERGAQLLSGARVRTIEQPSDATWRVVVQMPAGDHVMESRVVVDATGRTAWLSRRLGAEHQRIDRLIGVCIRCAPADGSSTGHDDNERLALDQTRQARDPGWQVRAGDPLLLVEAIEQGWWYSVPQPNGELVVVLMTDGDLGAPAGARWMTALGEAPLTSGRCDGLVPASRTPRVHLAHSARTRLREPRAIAVGDAAAAFDPLSSDGLCFAIRSGVEAARAIGYTFARGGASACSGGVRADYEVAVDRIFEWYLARRAAYYGAERRWSSAPFWARRHRPRLNA